MMHHMSPYGADMEPIRSHTYGIHMGPHGPIWIPYGSRPYGAHMGHLDPYLEIHTNLLLETIMYVKTTSGDLTSKDAHW